jgi:hypothetical protein
MVKINTFFAVWWSGPTSAERQGQNTALPLQVSTIVSSFNFIS